MYEIVPEQPFTSTDLNYHDSNSRSIQKQRDATARLAISSLVENIDQYDIVFLGYPIWNGQAPKIISSFLEGYDLNGKIIVPFCTSHSSGIGSRASTLHTLASSANWLDRNEKYYYRQESLPTNAQRLGNIRTGDLMIYGSDCLVVL